MALCNENTDDSWKLFQSYSQTTSSCVCWLHLCVVWWLYSYQNICSASAHTFSLGLEVWQLFIPSSETCYRSLLEVLILTVPDMSRGALCATSRAMQPECQQVNQVQLLYSTTRRHDQIPFWLLVWIHISKREPTPCLSNTNTHTHTHCDSL